MVVQFPGIDVEDGTKGKGAFVLGKVAENVGNWVHVLGIPLWVMVAYNAIYLERRRVRGASRFPRVSVPLSLAPRRWRLDVPPGDEACAREISRRPASCGRGRRSGLVSARVSDFRPRLGGMRAQSGVLGQMFSVVLTLLFLAVGGHLLWLRLVVHRVPRLLRPHF